MMAVEWLIDFLDDLFDDSSGLVAFFGFIIKLVLPLGLLFSVSIGLYLLYHYIVDNYIGGGELGLKEILRRHPRSRLKALQRYLESADEYSRQVAATYEELCRIKGYFSSTMNERIFNKYLDILISPEKVNEAMGKVSFGIVQPDRYQLTVMQTFLIAISNNVLGYLFSGASFVYGGQVLDSIGQDHKDLYFYYVDRLVESGFVDSTGHVWNKDDAKQQKADLEENLRHMF